MICHLCCMMRILGMFPVHRTRRLSSQLLGCFKILPSFEVGQAMKKKPQKLDPSIAQSHAISIIATAKDLSGIDLDFTPESIARIDELIEGFRNEGLSVNKVGATLFSFGCYIGEMLVRHHSGVWRNTEDTPMKGVAGAPLVVEFPNGFICSPIGKAYKRMEHGAEDSLAYFYQASVHGATQGGAPE